MKSIGEVGEKIIEISIPFSPTIKRTHNFNNEETSL